MDHEFHIVLIDDNVQLHDNVRAALQGERARVSSAFDPAAGLELLDQQPCDLLLLDLGLPGMDGFDLLARLKADPRTAALPVIVITAWDGAGDKERGFELGAVDYVTKPFEARELRARVRSVLRQARLQRELMRSNRELEAARNHALEATQAKSRFLANMSHEIRTPMNGVIAMTSLLLETPLTSDQQELVETIRSSGQSLLEIIDDILDFSKIEAGKLDLDPHPFDLRQCVEEAVALLAPRAAESRIELPVEIDSSLPAQVVGDATRLRQVLVNLLGNGVKFTARGEVALHVAGRPAGSAAIADKQVHDGPLWELEFTVRDTGIGIPPEKLDRLFESFVQVDASTTRQYGGTGLGLAICKSLVTMMGGRISVESTLGRGSTFRFTVRLPAMADAAAMHTPDAAAVAGMRLLVVDSNATSRRVIDLNARKWGATTRAAADGVSALELLRGSEPFDAALVDMQMPGVDGAALCREIRGLPGREKLPLILLTTLSTARVGEAVGSQAVLTKPLKLPQLLETLVRLRQPAVALSAPPPAPARSRLEGDLAARLPLRLLLVEDNVINQRVARRALQQMGYDCTLAVNGREAVEISAAQVFDLAFMDVQMPEMDGYEATQNIRARERAEQTPPLVIIGLTANALKGDREKCLDAGMDDYIPKPLDLERLQDAIKRWGPLALARRPAASTNGNSPTETAKPSVPGQAALPAVGAAAAGEEPPVDMPRLDEFSCGDPAQLRELVELYLEQTAGQLQQIKDAVARGDQAQVRRVAHSCAGASGTCGMSPIAAVMRELEMRANEGDLAAAPALVAEAEEEYVRLRGYLHGQLAARGVELAKSAAS